MFTRSDSVASGCIHADDTPLARRGNIHVIKAYSCPPDYSELLRMVDNFLGDLRRAPDGKAIIILNDAF